MVCLLGSSRMAAMARLLSARSVPQAFTGDLGYRKLATQYIYRELHQADEANLLDEEDMHVFDLKPMSDPLDLVCCNACKKPVKASQYAAHAELCKSMSSAADTVSEFDCNTRHKKPPRKKRKKLADAQAMFGSLPFLDHLTSNGGQGKFESMDNKDLASSESCFNDQTQINSSIHMDTKGNQSSVNTISLMDGSRYSPVDADYLVGAMPPPTKRSKVVAADNQQISGQIETPSGVTKSFCTSNQDAPTCSGVHQGYSAGSEKSCGHLIGCQVPRQVNELGVCATDVPAPLAAKMFYSQRNHRLRLALRHLYYDKFSCEDYIGLQEKRDMHSLTSEPNPDQILMGCSEVYSNTSGECPSSMDLSNPFTVNNVSRPCKSSGKRKLVGTMQQPK